MDTRVPGRRTNVLVLTSEVELARLARSILEPRCKVTAGELLRAKSAESDDAADIVIVDVESVDLAIVACVKRAYPSAQFIALCREYREADCIAVLDLGVDYLPRPFRAHELAARVRVAELRRFNATRRRRYYRKGPLVFDLFHRKLAIDGRPIALARSELAVLTLLASQAGTVVIYDRLLAELGLVGAENSRQALRTCVLQLRRKIEREKSRPEILLSEVGFGYRLAASMEGQPYRGTDPPQGEENWGSL